MVKCRGTSLKATMNQKLAKVMKHSNQELQVQSREQHFLDFFKQSIVE